MKARFQIDDWLIFASLWPNYTMIVTGSIMVGEGKAGLPTGALTAHQMVVFLKMFYASLITYIWTVTLVRTAILLLYRRIFDVKPFRRVATVLIVLCLVWGVSVCFANIFQCRHVQDAFNAEAISSPDDRCINLQNLYFGTVGTGFALDLIILVLPFQQIWGLRLERRQKYELIAILSLGGLACVASIIRITTLTGLDPNHLSYSVATVYMWSQIEPSAAILCACFVTYRPLFRDLRLGSYFSRKSGVSKDESDVSRRYPTNVDGSEEGSYRMKKMDSEDRLVERYFVNTTTIKHNDVLYPRDPVWVGP
ncbi:MAG: hypothetical protein LQ349_008674 [Xanthoria aureola]|nr:MAG: hypothetical protein LQ349_008674 [Xanthoria aureola]